ncbi:MAG TPA: A/G-specific adenine glycosylase [Rhodanobacteraceae bacterium]|jgi:A/G-specific adenine glycosylase|nr:A/G-specific adenine glycosylase [Rhodanobacteraceae bacterium]
MDGFARRLLDWYDRHGRRDLPWQHPRTPYRVWISEVMLQQTQVATVIPYFQRFVDALPDLPALAAADEDRVLSLWSGLGYYRRARHLHAAAKLCAERHASRLPRDFEALSALPGIGRSTAGAILALAHQRRHAILDGNVKRVLCRYHGVDGWPGERAVEKRLWSRAEVHTPKARIADYTQAIMDLGATVCTPRRPDCGRCPQRRTCAALREDRTASLPMRRPARVLPERQTIFIVLRDRRGRVLLQRRPPQGVWPGLWSLPEASTEQDARTTAMQWADLDGRAGNALPTIKHGFTHYTLQASPIEWRGASIRRAVADTPDLRWCDRAGIAELGIPAPVRKLLLCDAARDRP